MQGRKATGTGSGALLLRKERAGSPGSRPADLSPDDDRFLGAVACRIRGRRLAPAVSLWLESVRPLSFLGAQAMHFFTPFVRIFCCGNDWSRLAGLMENPAHLTRLLDHLADREAPSAGAGA